MSSIVLAAQQLELNQPFITLFHGCADEPWALFLDSATAAGANGRYDMILRAPSVEFEVRQQQLSQYDHRTRQQQQFPANQWQTVLRQALASLPDYTGPAELPFQGGLAGAFGYDFGRVLEDLPSSAVADIALPDLALGLYQQALIYDHQTGETWLVAPSNEIAELSAFWQTQAAQQPTAKTAFTLTNGWQSNMDEASYTRKFKQVQNYLRAGDCYQINLAQRFQAPYTGSEWSAYLQLRQLNKGPFSSFFNLPDGAILSLSPERFLAVDDQGAVETKPIKGTRPRHADPAVDADNAETLLQSPKDRAENVMIVDLLRNDLSRVCEPGSVQVPKLFAIESYPAVHHLVSTVIGKLPTHNDTLDLINAAFPGGSITGAPKIRAMAIIDELEPHRRSFYCGSMGYLSQHGRMDTNIAIRTLVCCDQNIYCWAGGGLVIDSEAAAEYQETFDKVQRILPVLEQTRHEH